jgi:regulatory protein
MTTERQEHLAPVTYLFGRAADEPGAPAASASAPAATATAATATSATTATATASAPAAPISAASVAADGNAELPADLAALRLAIAEVELSPAEPAAAPPRATRRAENVSMHALTKRGLSVSEMGSLLERRELEPDDVAAELERLESVGLLDDAALADSLVRSLHERKGLGKSAIVNELRRRRVESSAIDVAIEQLDASDELSRATELAHKRAPQLRNLDAETAKRRLSGFLMRRGYSGSVVAQAVTAALAATPTPTSTPRRGPRFE